MSESTAFATFRRSKISGFAFIASFAFIVLVRDILGDNVTGLVALLMIAAVIISNFMYRFSVTSGLLFGLAVIAKDLSALLGAVVLICGLAALIFSLIVEVRSKRNSNDESE